MHYISGVRIEYVNDFLEYVNHHVHIHYNELSKLEF